LGLVVEVSEDQELAVGEEFQFLSAVAQSLHEQECLDHRL
jgi:hypothetical protein